MGRIVAVLVACTAAIVGLVGAHAIEAGADRPSADRRTAQALPASRQLALTAVSFGNAQDGWVAAQLNQQGYILHTHDGGRSWTRYPVGFAATQMQFINGTDGWAVGTVPLGCIRSCRNVVEFTADGGRTWVQQHEASPCWLISSLQFANGADGWAVEANTMCGARRTVARLIRTTDGGRTWHIAFSMQAEVARLHFGGALHGWLAAGGAGTAQCSTVVFHSTDGGLTWTRQFRVNGYCMAQVEFVNGRQGWLLATNLGACSMGGCYDNRLYQSTDGGRHWALEQSATLASRHLWSGPSGFLGAPVFVTPQVGYIPVSAGAGPGRGGLDVTRDGGRHWDRQQPYGLEVGNISPVSAPEAWAVGCVQHADTCDVLLHTRDMGRTWQVVHPAPGTPPASAAQTMVQVVAGVAPCRASQLHATAAWQGATGSLAGGITIVSAHTSGSLLHCPQVGQRHAPGALSPFHQRTEVGCELLGFSRR